MNKAEKANKLIEKGLMAVGATKVDGEHYPYRLWTKFGLLILTLGDNESKSGVFSCCSKFIDVFSATRGGIACNPHSGKWNWHEFKKGMSAEAFAEKVLYDVRKVAVSDD